MVRVDTIEGIVNDSLWFHYDVGNDVLYLRLTSARDVETLGEETEDGFILLRRADTDAIAGLTVLGWWKRFGSGPVPDSIHELEQRIEPWAAKLAA